MAAPRGGGDVVRVALAQLRWREDAAAHRAAVAAAVREAVRRGARLVVLPELTLSPYFPAAAGRGAAAAALQEDVAGGPTVALCGALAAELGAHIVASLYERGGYNTAVVVGPGGIAGRCRKQHIPSSEGYGEAAHFRSGGAEYPVFPLTLGGVRLTVAAPTCYDQWFPELHRAYALRGADLLAFPTAIGAEAAAPGFDSSRAWRLAMMGQAVCNGTFVAACNRCGGPEPGALGGQSFYGTSFACAPDGELLADAGREEGVAVATVDLRRLRRWRELFPLLRRRRPADYRLLTLDHLPRL